MKTMRCHTAFTLIEMIVATIAATLLIAGVLLMTSTLGRDRARLTRSQSTPPQTQLLQQLHRDLTNSTTLAQLNNGHALILTGNNGIDPSTLIVNGRLSRVIYEIRGNGFDAALFRHQKYLDDPARSEDWTELISLSTTALFVIPDAAGFEPVERPPQPTAASSPEESPPPPFRRAPKQFFIPAHARIHMQRPSGNVDEDLWLR
jgi:hypothetical protein